MQTETPTNELTFAQARELYSTARWMKDDLPDGMWDELSEVGAEYRESDKTSDDKDYFVEGIMQCCRDWGFPTN